MAENYKQSGDIPETHRYGKTLRNEMDSPSTKRKVQVTIDPSAFARVSEGSCTPLCKRRMEGVLLRDKNSGSFPNTPQAIRRIEIAQGMMSATNSPVVSRRSDLMAQCRSPMLSRRSEILFSGESLCSSAGSSPIPGRRFDTMKAFGSPARSIGEPGVFSSPIHRAGIEDDDNDVDFADATDKTIVSGWLKFRDNKRVSQLLSIYY